MNMNRTAKYIVAAVILSLGFAGCKTDTSRKKEELKKQEAFELSGFISNGRPVYSELKEEEAVFQDHLADLASFDVRTLKTDGQKTAFWINAYNVFVIKILLDNYPDKKDIFQIEGFFDSKKLEIAGVELSLNDISSTVLKFGAQIKDPRINFTLSNGTKSSPKLRKDGYSGDKIEAQLDQSVRNFLKDGNLIIDRKLSNVEGKQLYVVKLSQMFEWFKDEFKIKYGGILDFLSKYVSEEDKKFLQDNGKKIHIEYLPYDWEFANF